MDTTLEAARFIIASTATFLFKNAKHAYFTAFCNTLALDDDLLLIAYVYVWLAQIYPCAENPITVNFPLTRPLSSSLATPTRHYPIHNTPMKHFHVCRACCRRRRSSRCMLSKGTSMPPRSCSGVRQDTQSLGSSLEMSSLSWNRSSTKSSGGYTVT